MRQADSIDVRALPGLPGGRLAKVGVLVFPTDTVYGLGCRAADEKAIGRLRELKGRLRPEPFSLHVGSLADGLALVGRLSVWQERLVARWLPGPVTVLLPAGPLAPPDACFEGKLGLRVPASPDFVRVYDAFGALLGTSVNRRGDPPMNDLGEIARAFGEEVDLFVRGSAGIAGMASSVVDLCVNPPVVLRGTLPDSGCVG